MKKLLITAALATTSIFASAQDMMSKRGTPILPEAGDWSIGVDATDLLRYFGNLFTKDVNNNSSLSPQIDQTLTGLYVTNESTAIRLKLRIGFGTDNDENIIAEDGGTAGETVVDTRKETAMNFTIGGGLQKWRGKGRLKGLYGAELGFGIGTGKTTYEYGNSFETTNTTPNTTDWSNMTSGPDADRDLEVKNGSTFMVNLNGFIGAEYFFAPKMSLSGEYAWGLSLNSTAEGERISEAWDIIDGDVDETTSTIGKSSTFNLDVTNIGSVTLHFYF